MIEQNMDYRFNNNLQNACKLDIKKYCFRIIGKCEQYAGNIKKFEFIYN